MKILCSGDWHIRATNPRYRIDNYYETLMRKIDWIFELASKERCEIILQPGDFFDSPDQANHVEIDLIDRFQKYWGTFQIFSVFGQHDCKYRNRGNTALEKFYRSQFIGIAGSTPYSLDGNGNIMIYGSSWEEDISTPQKDEFSILIIHRMIVKDSPLWADQTDYISAKDMLKKYPDYSLIVSGDNHQSFLYEKNNRRLINCGSLMRTTIAQRDHKPVVYIVDSETNEITKHEIPIRPIEEVMNLELADEIKERNEDLEAFMNGLSSNYDAELSFEKNFESLVKMNETSKEIRGIAEEIIGRYYSGN